MRYPWTLIFLILMMSSLGGCQSKDDSKLPTDMIYNPNSAVEDAKPDHLPVITFDADEHDFGRIIQGEVVTYAFKFRNTGKSDLLISSVSSSCGCTVSKYSKEPVRPGEQGVLQVTFNSEGRKGFQSKTVTVLTNAQPNKHTLTVKAKIEIPER
ncbi:MAG TPA: DUF1573 domain-containing protein [Bacteroidales bacterium]|nr:DUF1573 domain-containing protein [Bacteroidales bacterium]HNS45840.1 DUF1573 domain-containing protein [Bacteroidales bacterium]